MHLRGNEKECITERSILRKKWHCLIQLFGGGAIRHRKIKINPMSIVKNDFLI